MATATAKKSVKKVTTLRPAAEGANFQPKRVRKAQRKKLISKRSLVGDIRNKAVDARLTARERAEFYRNLRQIKLSRRKISKEMATLSLMVHGLQRDIRHVSDRYYHVVDVGLIDEAMHIAKQANAAMAAAADEMQAFSRKRVYFTQVMGAAA